MDAWEKHALKILQMMGAKEKKAYKKLSENYEKVTREVMSDLSGIYAKLDKGESLTFADVHRYNDLQKFQSRVMAQVTLLGNDNRKIIKNLLEEGYDLSFSYMSYAIEKEAQVLLAGAAPNLPELLDQVWDNPIYGLALEPAQEKDRAKIVRDLNGAIDKGLRDGDTYGGIAKNIQDVFESSRMRSMRIARTETHRVRERGNQDSSLNAHRQGVKMDKIWRNMDDERVRDTKKANHVEMEGVRVAADQPFIMKSNPQNSGMVPGSIYGPDDAAQNIHCRCYTSRRISHLEQQVPKQMVEDTFEDWQKVKRGEYVNIEPKTLDKQVQQEIEQKPKPEMKEVSNSVVVTEFKTYEDAVTWGKENNINIDLNKLPVDVATGIVARVEKTLNRIPILKGYLLNIKDTGQLGKFSGEYAHASGKGVSFNPKVWGTGLENVEKHYEKDKISGFHVKDTDALSIVTHELGHTLENLLTKQGTTRTAKGLLDVPEYAKDIRKKVLKDLKIKVGKIESNLSRYAKMNPGEFFAEAFCEWLDSPTPRPIAMAVGAEVERVIKEVEEIQKAKDVAAAAAMAAAAAKGAAK